MLGPNGRMELEDDNANAVSVARGLLNIDDEGNDLAESDECQPCDVVEEPGIEPGQVGLS